MAAAAGGAKQEEICNIVTRKSGFGAASKISIAEISSHRLSRMLEKVRAVESSCSALAGC